MTEEMLEDMLESGNIMSVFTRDVRYTEIER